MWLNNELSPSSCFCHYFQFISSFCTICSVHLSAYNRSHLDRYYDPGRLWTSSLRFSSLLLNGNEIFQWSSYGANRPPHIVYRAVLQPCGHYLLMVASSGSCEPRWTFTTSSHSNHWVWQGKITCEWGQEWWIVDVCWPTSVYILKKDICCTPRLLYLIGFAFT